MSLKKRFSKLYEILTNEQSKRILEMIEEQYYDSLEALEKEYHEKLAQLESDTLNIPDLKKALEQCLAAGEKWPRLKKQIQTMYFEMARKKYKNCTTAGNRLGLSRTSISEHLNKVRKNDALKIIQVQDE